jgi:hypothetical protein
MCCRLAFVRTDVSEERNALIIRVTRIGERGTTLAVTSNRRALQRNTVTANLVPSLPIFVTLMMEAIFLPVPIRATLRHNPDDGTLHI